MPSAPRPDPILIELYRHRFAGIAEEMGITLRRTSFSPNIKERLDFSCAIFDTEARLVAQAAHIPVHLGAMPASVASAMHRFESWEPGDLVILNDPFAGGTHLPDITMVSPVFLENDGGQPGFFLASRAHHADVGGMSPGSLPLSTEIYQEGIIIPPVKWYRAGKPEIELLDLILRNVRTPEERRGDLAAQHAAHATGERRLIEMAERFGGGEVSRYARHLQEYAERLVRSRISAWPSGEYRARDHLMAAHPDGHEERADLIVTITLRQGSIRFDFTGSSPQVPSSLNAVLGITQSACYYTILSLAGSDLPVNHGCFAPVEVVAPRGSIVNAVPPAAVAGGNVETSQRIVEICLRALAEAVPDEVPAASQGTMNNLTIGGTGRDGKPFAYYETIGGGMGASPRGDGLSGVHVHMSNTQNTPVEALETVYPFRILRYALRRGSGGTGRHRGGDGLVREYEFELPAVVTVLSERRDAGPPGLAAGSPGEAGRNLRIDVNGFEHVLPSKFTRTFEAGERLVIETPGGGGWGSVGSRRTEEEDPLLRGDGREPVGLS